MSGQRWRQAPLKRVARVMPSNVDKHSVEGEQTVQLCNYVDVYKNERITTGMDLMRATASAAQIARFTLMSGDVLVTKDSEAPSDIGIPAHVPADLPGVVCGYHLAILRPDAKRVHGAFLHWAVQAYEVQAYYTTAATGISRYALSINDMEMTPIFLPSLSTQVSIANFLDEQTARIDTLIAEKGRLLVVLAEQRISVAEQVLRDNPFGTRAKLGFHVDLLPGYAFPSDAFTRNPDDVPLLRGVNVAPANIRWDDCVYWAQDDAASLERFRVRTCDVVFGMDRPWISTGARVAMIDEASDGALLLQRVCRLRGRGRMHQRFIFYALASDLFRQSVEIDLTGVSVPHISPDQVLRFKVPVLSLNEQRLRCDAADAVIAQIATLEAHTCEMLDRLREYRSSLISAAVTGQLDINSCKEAA